MNIFEQLLSDAKQAKTPDFEFKTVYQLYEFIEERYYNLAYGLRDRLISEGIATEHELKGSITLTDNGRVELVNHSGCDRRFNGRIYFADIDELDDIDKLYGKLRAIHEEHKEIARRRQEEKAVR